ncbi:geranylgeranylglyceryl/heptaprenylglyceryl phosphate synthase [Arundinibacter roseus]|uniref:Geranylgeranylglyceryl phosphate synthase n=1 Tax=Arundinibacter roseus TaxID=2070510 RepID=A0A4R4KLK8_9BACT|nr:geranylgeranylglyceryl/heptaprenylglyceryl phosphate synthase [Arundinibacter roseus]TDB69260.1 geranylgeranylglyceryl/heptaprenylglyceryl phosphate synthase [Arundinibacter roseus]
MQQENHKIADLIQKKRTERKKSFAVLLDPDKIDLPSFPEFLGQAVACGVDFFFVGGSLVTRYAIDDMVAAIHTHTSIPAILFPGNSLHIEPSADAILLLSLISGRNPELLIGQHVVAAPLLRQSSLEILPTGYMLVESGKLTTVSYMSNTIPMPSDKPGVAACTAMAGEMLGLRYMYLDAGSGAQQAVPEALIAAVRSATNTPLIVGGGINTGEKAYLALEAGADIIVVGNGIEQNSYLLPEIAQCVKAFNQKTLKAI